MDAQAQSYGNFDLVKRIDVDYVKGMTVEKWRSRVTGLQVIKAGFDAPILNAYFTLATEIFEDSGVPHTLEHLIFLGSQEYPYKGVLDSLANRSFASGTNAWTATDYTAYTLATAGSEGFLKMMPVYLDHVLFPTLTSTGFTTEVYHVNGKAKDAGVVYSEMQGRENTVRDLMMLKAKRLLYPPSSAYRSETGGLMKALRVLTIEDIRKYHSKYYVPHNLSLIIAGKVDTKDLLDSLASVEAKAAKMGFNKGPHPPGWQRPFLSTPSSVPPVIPAQGLTETVPFPEHDESVGKVALTFVGPKLDNFLENKALEVLDVYLTDSTVSVLQKEFVEREDPFCTELRIYPTERAGCNTLHVDFSSVPVEHLDTLPDRLKEVLQRLVKEGVDMQRMKMVIRREKLTLLNTMEMWAPSSMAYAIIADSLYGEEKGEQLAEAFDDMARYKELDTWDASKWATLIQKYFISEHAVVVKGKPSAELADKLEKDEKARTKQLKEQLGAEGLAKLEAALEEAKKENDREIPTEILSGFKVPDWGSIHWIPVSTGRNMGSAKLPPPERVGRASEARKEADRMLQQHVDRDGQELPFFVQYDHVDSNFVTLSLLLSTSTVPAPLRPYIGLYTSTLFSLPVTRADGTKLSYEEVVPKLDDDTVEYEVNLGAGGSFLDIVNIKLKLESAKYAEGIAWLRDLVWNSVFDVDRLKVATARIVQSLPEQKRDGDVVAWAMLDTLLYDTSLSTAASNSILSIAAFYPRLAQQLSEEPEKVVKDMEVFRQALIKPEMIRVSVAGDVFSLDKPRGPWRNHFVELQKSELAKVPWAKGTLSELGRGPAKKGVICSLPTIESSFAVFTAKGIDSFTHPDYAPLKTAIAILNAMESCLWRFIRGAGLAYGAWIQLKPESAHIHFELYRSPNAYAAFSEAQKLMKDLASGEMEIDETSIESAKSSLHYDIARTESTVGGAAARSFVNQALFELPAENGRQVLEEIKNVSHAGILRVLRTYLLPLFEPVTSVAVVVAAPSVVDDIQKGLTDVGYDMERRTLDFGKEEDEKQDEEEEGSEEEGESSEEEKDK